MNFEGSFLQWLNLIYSLFTLVLHQILMNFISSFLKHYSAQIQQLSSEFLNHFSKGSPKISCLSLIKWLAVLETLLRRCIRDNFISIVQADEILRRVWARLRVSLQTKGMDALCIIEQWTQENLISISIYKCLVLTYSNPKILKRPQLFKDNLKNQKEVVRKRLILKELKYLGELGTYNCHFIHI